MKTLKLTPDQKADWVPEEYGELFALSLAELQKVTSEKKKWPCCVEGCNRTTSVIDYGVPPFYVWRKGWICVDTEIYFCGRHWPIYRKNPEAVIYKNYNPFYAKNSESTAPFKF